MKSIVWKICIYAQLFLVQKLMFKILTMKARRQYLVTFICIKEGT